MWLVIGLAVGAGLVVMELWVRNRNLVVTWYDRLIGAVGIVLLLFTAQNFITAFAESEPAATWMFLLVLGLPALILLAIAGGLIARRQRAAA